MRFSATRSSWVGTPITCKGPRPGRSSSIRRPPFIPRSSRLRIRFAKSSARSTRSSVARLISASTRLAAAISVTRRSMRRTSWAAMPTSWARRSGSSTRGRVSMALRKDASGFLISCATSAAKLSTASMRWRSAPVMSETARASRPISSLRWGRRGTSTSRSRPCFTRTAARASRRSGVTMVRAKNSESAAEAAITSSIATNRVERAARTLSVMSTALRTVSSVAP